jgi:hypothetical protein
MNLLTILVAILLGACALIFVLYPIYERTQQSVDGQDDHGKPDRNIVGAQGLPPRLAPALDKIHALDETSTSDTTPTLEHTQEEREQTARSALQEVELDFQLGNLAESDYRSLRERYMRRAVLAMKSRHEREQELDEAIEEQLRRMREMDEQAKEQ